MAATLYNLWLYSHWYCDDFLPHVSIPILLTRFAINDKHSVVKGLGKNNITTLLLTTPPYLIAVIAILANAWHADKTGERYLHVSLPPIISVIAFIIAVTTTAFAPRYLWVMPTSGFSKC